jgi:DNA-binding CsgD family transcriptional regulator
MDNKTRFTDMFFEAMPECSLESDNVGIIFENWRFTNMLSEAIYVLDFKNRNICYVSDNGLLLCGHSCTDILEAGYEFYKELIHPDDLQIWIKMHNVILLRLCNSDSAVESIDYFSCTFRIASQLRIDDKIIYIMVYHRLKPVCHQGKIQFGICAVSSSVIPTSGNLRLYYDDGLYYDSYSFENKEWLRMKNLQLSKHQKLILELAMQGKTNEQMADIMCTSIKTIENSKTSLFKKLGVKTVEQAVIFATNHQLIFK